MKITEIVIIFLKKNRSFVENSILIFKNFLIYNNLTILNIEKWGILRLCYNIKKQNKGFFVLFRFYSTNSTISYILKYIKLNNSYFIRFLIVSLKKNNFYSNFDTIRKLLKNNAFKKKNKKKL